MVVNLVAFANCADCGACDATGFACANRNTVQICNNGLLTESTFVCPDRYVCLSSSLYPCVSPLISPYDCQEKCSGVCPFDTGVSSSLSFICLGPSTYEICNNLGLPYPIIADCPDGQVCTNNMICAPSDENYKPVCPEGEIVTSQPETVLTTVTTPSTDISITTRTSTTSQVTTPQASKTPDEVCAGKANRSKYPLSPADPFCKK